MSECICVYCVCMSFPPCDSIILSEFVHFSVFNFTKMQLTLHTNVCECECACEFGLFIFMLMVEIRTILVVLVALWLCISVSDAAAHFDMLGYFAMNRCEYCNTVTEMLNHFIVIVNGFTFINHQFVLC